MAQFKLPKNSQVVKGNYYKLENVKKEEILKLHIYRYNPNLNQNPRLDTYEVLKENKSMVLDLLMHIKDHVDESLSFRKSCREGICGSCTCNINGKNALACITNIDSLGDEIHIYPLPHMPVLKDLVVDLKQPYKHYESIKPWLSNDHNYEQNQEHLQSPEQREKLDGLWECILCFACSTSCPSYWWNSKNGYLGPSALLQQYRWVADSRDTKDDERLDMLDNERSLFSCRNILNCNDVCPKGLKPNKAITELRKLLTKRA